MARVQLVIRYIYIALYKRNAKAPDSVASYARFARPLAVSNYRLAVAQRPQTVCLSVYLSEKDVNDQARKMDLHKKKKKKKKKTK